MRTPRRGLTFRGVAYDVGTAELDGVLSRRRWNKPIWILEFGCGTFEGAGAGMDWNVVDYSKDPAEIPAEVVRSERKKYDYDIAAYSLVKSIRTSHLDEESPYYPLPKRSFAAVARHNLAYRR